METCKISIYLAYGMAIYLFASIFYLIFTRSIGTPFNDSLNEKQKIIKKKSSKLRGIIFVEGLFLGLVLSLIFKPFNKC
jgi:hypothetical protein